MPGGADVLKELLYPTMSDDRHEKSGSKLPSLSTISPSERLLNISAHQQQSEDDRCGDAHDFSFAESGDVLRVRLAGRRRELGVRGI